MASEKAPTDDNYERALHATASEDPTSSRVNITDDSELNVSLNGIKPVTMWIHSKMDLFYSFVDGGTLTEQENQLFVLAGSTPITRGTKRIDKLKVRRAENKIGKVYFTLSN